MKNQPQQTPGELGYYFPAEWAAHESTWLSWPHKEASWPGKIESIYPVFIEFIKELAKDEKVNINVIDDEMRASVFSRFSNANLQIDNIFLHIHPTNDAWCRDHGPAFLINPKAEIKKVIVDWNYNAWGNKYPPFDLDDVIPTKIGKKLDIPVFHPGIIMEGGSVDFNGSGTIITTSACLLNKNRNAGLKKHEIERYLFDFYGCKQVLWLEDGIVGDDTDGHIDDITRFISEDTVVTVVEDNRMDDNFKLLLKNLKDLKSMRLLNDKQLNIVELPMPDPVIYEGQRLPTSYANFYIANKKVIVPTFQCKKDALALEILEKCFPTHEVIGLDSVDLIWGLGSFHCLSQQEPKV
jgi:agmatine deiminase